MQVELYIQDNFQPSLGRNDNPEDDSTSVTLESWDNWFQNWLEVLQIDIPPASSYEIGLRLTHDKEIQELNSQYRHQDKPTDVLAFAAMETELPQLPDMISLPLYLGDIVISIDTAKRQAKQQEHSLSTELAWLAAHGLLHLLGWDHPDEASLLKMLQQQVILLKSVGITIDLE